MTVDQISIFVENKPGKLVEVTETIAAAGIDLRAMSIADTTDFGILRVIVDNPKQALLILQEAGYLVKPSKVIPVAVDDTPGGLAKTLRTLANAGIDVEYLYAFVAHGTDKAYVIIRVGDSDAALTVLHAAGVSIMSEKEMYEM